MRKWVLAALSALALSGCASSIENAYDDHAYAECEREAQPGWQRADCYDSVERNRRDHR